MVSSGTDFMRGGSPEINTRNEKPPFGGGLEKFLFVFRCDFLQCGFFSRLLGGKSIKCKPKNSRERRSGRNSTTHLLCHTSHSTFIIFSLKILSRNQKVRKKRSRRTRESSACLMELTNKRPSPLRMRRRSREVQPPRPLPPHSGYREENALRRYVSFAA